MLSFEKNVYGELDSLFFPDPLCTILPTSPLTDLRKPLDLWDFLCCSLAVSLDCSLIWPKIPTNKLSTLWLSIVDVSVNSASNSLASCLPSANGKRKVHC